jgi:hypothetical protein
LDLVCPLGPGDCVSVVRHQDLLNTITDSEELLSLGQRHEDCGAVRPRSVVVDNLPDGQDRPATCREEGKPISGCSHKIVGCLSVDEHLAGTQRIELRRIAVLAGHRAETVHRSRVGREEHDVRFGVPARHVLDGNRLADRRRDGVDARSPACDLDHLCGLLGFEVASLRTLTQRLDVGGVGRSCGHDFVGLSEGGDHRGADGAGHDVAEAQGGTDDHRAEHQPPDDDRRAGRTAADVADAELDQNSSPNSEEADDRQGHQDDNGEHLGQHPDRHPEQLTHRSPPLNQVSPTGGPPPVRRTARDPEER